MLKNLKKLVGGFNILWNRLRVLSIRVGLKLRGKRLSITQDASTLKTLDPLGKNLLSNASKTMLSPEQLQQFLSSSIGQRIKARAIVTYSEEIMMKLVEKIQTVDPQETAQIWTLNLALMETINTIHQNEEFLNPNS